MKQVTALDILKQGHNVFLTGQAGSGKTYVLNQYIEWLRSHAIEPAVTASTGIAATHIGGVTIHSWSGMGINDQLTGKVLDELLQKEAVWRRIGKSKVLIIDEISMVSPLLLDAIDQICRNIHENHEQAFGGMQVVCCGDFFQLPPIMRRQTPRSGQQAELESQELPKSKLKRYAWQSQAWLDADTTVCYLDEQYRQDDGDRLTRILNDIRDGEATEDSLTDLRERFTAEIDPEHPPIRLYTHNTDVDSINNAELDRLETAPHYFEMYSKGAKKNIEILRKGCLALENLELREGAIVMFVRNNYEKGYVNGSMGVVTGFDEKTEYPLVELYSGGSILAAPDEWSLEIDGKKSATLSQIPLRLAWAITIHKSQGMSLDAAEIDLSKCFEVGQGYVALSRVRSLEGLYIKGFNTMATTMDPLTLRVDARFQELSKGNSESQLSKNIEQTTQKIDGFIEQCGGSIDEVDYVSEKEKQLESTYEQTHKLIIKKMSLEDIASERQLAVGTIVGHVAALQRQGHEIDLGHVEINDELVETVREAYDEIVSRDDKEMFGSDGQIKLREVYKVLDGEVSYDDIKLALLFIENVD